MVVVGDLPVGGSWGEWSHEAAFRIYRRAKAKTKATAHLAGLAEILNAPVTHLKFYAPTSLHNGQL